MARYSAPGNVHYSFGPGPVPFEIKAIIWANVLMFVASVFVPSIPVYLGLAPVALFERLAVWQPLTYMFLHGGVFHILFNMFALWMFGVELERLWGPRFFVRYYFVCGLGAAATTLVVSLLPFSFANAIYYSLTIGASGAIYGLLLAYALYFPDRPIYLYMFLPIPARIFVLILGGISFLSSVSGAGGGVAHVTHLGGLVAGYIYLQRHRGRPLLDVRYQLMRLRMRQARRKFGIHQGGRDDWGSRVH